MPIAWQTDTDFFTRFAASSSPCVLRRDRPGQPERAAVMGAEAASTPLALLLVLLLEEFKDACHSPADDVPVAAAGNFQVLVRHVQLLHLLHPAPRPLRL